MKETLVAVARKVAEYLSEIRRPSTIVRVNSSGDTSKIFDLEAEDIIFEELRRGIKECFLFVSEESGVRRFCDEPKWVVVVDPVDGSMNYDAQIPWVSISIAVAPLEDREPTIGDVSYAVVYDVFHKIDYSYDQVGGVTIAGVPARRRSRPPGVVLGYFESPDSYKVIPYYWTERGSRASLRSLGSAALDIIYVGFGNAEVFVDTRAKLRNVDVAAALRIALVLGAKAKLCSGINASSVTLKDITRIECLLVGYDENYLNKLSNAYLKSQT
ncbi:MAG: inositol monophosphatase family protein [Desulfurococcaceae archaeon TW002]